MELTSTDFNAWITYTMPAAGHSSTTELLLPYQELCNIVRSSVPEDVLEVRPGEENTLIITRQIGAQKVEHRLDTLPVSEFPETPQFSDTAVSLPSGVPSALMVAQECASADSTRYVLNGAFLDVSSDEGHYIVGTDGRHLVASNSFKLPIGRSLIVPNHKFLEWKGFMTDGDWKFNLHPASSDSTGVFQISSNQWRFICREIDAQYPQWKHVLPDPQSYKTHVEFAPDDLESVAQIIQRLPCHSEQWHTLGLEISRRHLRLLGRSRADAPWTKVEVPTAEISGAPLTIFVDRELLLKAFRFGLSRISVIDSISPLLLTNTDRSRQMIIMPLRGEGEVTPSEDDPPTAPASADHSDVIKNSSDQTLSPSEIINANPNPDTMPIYDERPTTTTIITAAAPRRDCVALLPEAPEVPQKPMLEAALEHVESIKSGFREGITQLSKLSDLLRQAMREQRTTNREFQAVRQTLRSLQNVRI